MHDFITAHAGIVWYWVNHYGFMCEERGDIDRDDLFQAGCMGLIEAERTFDSSKGTWSTWASFYIRKYIRETLGRRKQLQTVPLDMPAYRDDDVTLGETLPDHSITPDDDRLLAREIVQTVRTSVNALPEDTAPVVRSVGLLGLSRAAAALKLGIPADEVRRMYNRGLRDLRKDRKLIELVDLDRETPFHAHKGVAAFHSSGSSVVEDLVEWRLRKSRL